jgi:hypothetical protein
LRGVESKVSFWRGIVTIYSPRSDLRFSEADSFPAENNCSMASSSRSAQINDCQYVVLQLGIAHSGTRNPLSMSESVARYLNCPRSLDFPAGPRSEEQTKEGERAAYQEPQRTPGVPANQFEGYAAVFSV